MVITKLGILHTIILVVLSIPLDQEIYDASLHFFQTHPAIYKLLPILKKLTPNDNNLRRDNNVEINNKREIDPTIKSLTNIDNNSSQSKEHKPNT